MMRLLIVLGLAALIGCGSGNSKPDTKASADETTDKAKKLTNSIGMKFTLIPAGEFLMGSPTSELGYDDKHEDEESPQHRVRITKPFYLGQTEVTQGQWQALMGTTPWSRESYERKGAKYAATYVSWDDAQDFCRTLGRKEGKSYRLPTEAEWEYACRAGTTTKYSYGNDDSRLGDYAWYEMNTYKVDQQYAHAVGLKRPNPWGLYDMHGNVWEWCDDWNTKDYSGNSRTDDPSNSTTGSSRVFRGGCWYLEHYRCRSAQRNGAKPDGRSFNVGFRVVLVP